MILKRIIPFLLIALLATSCSGKKKSRPDTSLETGRAFIRASLDGDFETARELLIPDSANSELFSSYENFYNRMQEKEKENFRKASYEINKLSEINDSTVIINYSNSYLKKPIEIKVIKKTGIWMVDFEFISANESN